METVDPNSSTWRAIESWIDERLQIRRSATECCGVPMDETENARGAIEELNELRQLGKPQTTVLKVFADQEEGGY